ncbi:MAG: serpin family protein, partial [Bacteroidales bacterium]|nr:serpin family protein [Bacteroidales bacterium]
MRKIIKYSSVALLLVLISCNTQKSSKTKNSNLVNNTVVNYKDGLIDFSFDYFKQLVKTDNKNICTSPLSLSLAMGMIYEGADENTYAQIANAMNFPADISNFYNTVSEYYSQIEAMSADTNMEMNIVNRVYIEESLKVNSKYINNVSKNFKAKVEDVNF